MVGATTGAVAGIAALVTYGLLASKGLTAVLAAKTVGGLKASGAGVASGASAAGSAGTSASGFNWLKVLMPTSAGAVGGGASGLGIARKAIHDKLEQAREVLEEQTNAVLQRVQELETRLDDSIVTETPTDNLEQIKGIGPKFAGLLRDMGIHTVEDLAQANPEKLHAILDASPAKQMMKVEDWIAQAQQLVSKK
jgi:predicted flap endonuclease-1-like 5' DNA nuclease